ncbi:proline dehydrogenase [Cutibacterium acnes JCM 18918]|nr:proline dehydrogenase [Cutibacterium acnes JCM 18918]
MRLAMDPTIAHKVSRSRIAREIAVTYVAGKTSHRRSIRLLIRCLRA